VPVSIGQPSPFAKRIRAPAGQAPAVQTLATPAKLVHNVGLSYILYKT
jgi:hypothetical protein